MKAREVIANWCDGSMMETAEEDADVIIAALDAAGYVIVPKEPTEAMLNAGCDATTSWVDDEYQTGPETHQMLVAWRDMLAASQESEK